MSGPARIGVLVAAVVAIAVAFVLLSPSADEDSTTATTPTTAAPATTTTGTGTTTAPAAPPPPPAPTFERIRVTGGEPAGGVQRIRVRRGDRARIEVTTTDTSDEIHLHGYDLYRDLAPGGRARFSFDATAEGIFEIELHGNGALIGQLEVRPR
ncbi:MAG: hypothetical protein Q8O56_03405 [Solirubrobacteraceae bacterium]|nr:hypothetical protein [Solirubrobacteraceae bacterium]